MIIKVLGTGCPSCRRLRKAVEETVQSLGVEAEILDVKDIESIMSYRIMATPALVINEQVKATGRIPAQAELASFITTALAQE